MQSAYAQGAATAHFFGFPPTERLTDNRGGRI